MTGPVTATPTESPTAAPEEQAVFDAYNAFYDAMVKAEADPQQSQVYLEPVATGAQFETTNGAIKARLLDGIEAYGAARLSPKVDSIEGDTAVVHDCQDTSGVGTRKIATGEELTIGREAVSAKTTLKFVDGVWKVAATEFVQPRGAYC